MFIVQRQSGPASNHDEQTSVLNDGAASNLPDDGICLIGDGYCQMEMEHVLQNQHHHALLAIKNGLLAALLTQEHSTYLVVSMS